MGRGPHQEFCLETSFGRWAISRAKETRLPSLFRPGQISLGATRLPPRQEEGSRRHETDTLCQHDTRRTVRGPFPGDTLKDQLAFQW